MRKPFSGPSVPLSLFPSKTKTKGPEPHGLLMGSFGEPESFKEKQSLVPTKNDKTRGCWRIHLVFLVLTDSLSALFSWQLCVTVGDGLSGVYSRAWELERLCGWILLGCRGCRSCCCSRGSHGCLV